MSLKDSLTILQRDKIQFLRGIAIITVVVIHNMPNGIVFQIYLRPFINFSVAIFLSLSGMLSTVNDWNPKKRIIKVLIPYVLWTFIYSLIYCYNSLDALPLHFVKYLITAGAPAMMYYVYVYIQCTLLVPLIDKVAKSKLWFLGLIVSPLEIILFRLIPLLYSIEFHHYIRIIKRISCLGWFSFFYLGYLLGNNIIKIRKPAKAIIIYWLLSIPIQIAEGIIYQNMGSGDCGTQLKLTAVLSGMLFILISYQYIISERKFMINFVKRLGDISFGIYFSNIAVMRALALIPGYTRVARFPINATFTIIVCSLFIVVCKKLFGKYGKYLAL